MYTQQVTVREKCLPYRTGSKPTCSEGKLSISQHHLSSPGDPLSQRFTPSEVAVGVIPGQMIFLWLSTQHLFLYQWGETPYVESVKLLVHMPNQEQARLAVLELHGAGPEGPSAPLHGTSLFQGGNTVGKGAARHSVDGTAANQVRSLEACSFYRHCRIHRN